jgi:hypothetical protein
LAVSKAIRRLLHLLNMEEEMNRRQLEAARVKLAQLETALKAAGQQERSGRQLFNSGVLSEVLPDRLAGLEEVHAAIRLGAFLQQNIELATSQFNERREEYFAKRLERRQAETLVEAAEATHKIEVNRKSQHALDEWYLTSQPNEKSKTNREAPENSARHLVDDSD